MVKVTGGGASSGAVAAHVSYIGRQGQVELETDEGERVIGRAAQREILKSWQLDLCAGQYRRQRNGYAPKRSTRLVYNIVLSMPWPTAPEKVLVAARAFAREKFALRHRYALVLHTDQKHPHVHLVVKAEPSRGRRLRIDKATLRIWREDFAKNMREQGVEANATPSVYRRKKNVKASGAFLFRGEPAAARLKEAQGAIVEQWMSVAAVLERQGEISLAEDVRHFVTDLYRERPNSPRVPNLRRSGTSHEDRTAGERFR